MPETLRHITALRAEGHAAVVSGAGPTLCVFAQNSTEAAAVVDMLTQRAAKSEQHWDVRILPVDSQGATMEVFRPYRERFYGLEDSKPIVFGLVFTALLRRVFDNSSS